MGRYEFHTVDVFTQHRFGGNQLAVVLGADDLSQQQMQQVAAEFGYSETTFVSQPNDSQYDAAVRIFTPVRELPFAGHPNVGTAFVLAHPEIGWDPGPVGRSEFRFEQGGTVVVVTLEWGIGSGPEEAVLVGAQVRSPVGFAVHRTVEPEVAARALGLSPDSLADAAHPPTIASSGVRFLFVELADDATLSRCSADARLLGDLWRSDEVVGVMPYVAGDFRGGLQELTARMFAPAVGVPEDPATGSAVGGLVGLLSQNRSGERRPWRWRVFQGEDMGRDSVLTAAVTRVGADRISIVGGGCQLVASGSLRV